MPRVAKDIDQQIHELSEKITKTTKHLQDLKTKHQELLKKKNDLTIQEISRIIAEKNLSPEQAVEILRNHNNG